MFKEASIYMMKELITNDMNELSDALELQRFNDNDLNESASGFVEIDEKMVVKSDNALFFMFASGERKAPRDQLDHLTRKRIDELQEKGEEITNQLRNDIENTARGEILKFQPMKVKRVPVMVVHQYRMIIVGAKQSALCESALKSLRKALGVLKVLPVDTYRLGCRCAESWLFDKESKPTYLCTLEADHLEVAGETASDKITFKGISPNPTIEGMSVLRLAMTLLVNKKEESEALAYFHVHFPHENSSDSHSFKLSRISLDVLEGGEDGEMMAYFAASKLLPAIVFNLIHHLGGLYYNDEKDWPAPHPDELNQNLFTKGGQ